MNRVIRSRLSALTLVSLLALIFAGCAEVCMLACGTACLPLLLHSPGVYAICAGLCTLNTCLQLGGSQYCTETPEECAATFLQLQTEAIQFCVEYPEECASFYNDFAESLDTGAED